MLLLPGMAAAAVLSAVQLICMQESVTPMGRLFLILRNVLLVTLVTLVIFHYGFRRHFLMPGSTTAGSVALMGGIAVVVGVALYVCGLAAERLYTHGSAMQVHWPIRLAMCALVFAGVLCITMTVWGKQEFGDLPIDQALVTFLSPTTGSGQSDFISAYEGPVSLSLLCAVGFWMLTRFPVRCGLCWVLAASIFCGGIGYGVHRFHLLDLRKALFQESDLIEETYVDPRSAHIQFPEKKRNLIHIYLESMENSYMGRENGGFMEEDLIPELTKLAGEGVHFSHSAQGFGGPESAVGTTWSVASMVNMSTGLPMKLPANRNDYRHADRFLPGACALGDLLHQEGYEQTLMFGADADFGGLSTYFKTHGDFKIMDYQYARKHGMIPKDYFVWWGFEDDKLYEFAKEELTRLSQTGKPFHFVMENADTHRPDGYLSPKAPAPYPSPYANVVAYSSAQVADFIRWIQKQPFYENTTVVVTGDHLSMESNFFKYYGFPEGYRRSQYHVILNPAPGVVGRDEKVFHNRSYGNFDLFPTILTSLDARYDGSRLGIGTDLFSGEKTIFEEIGFEEADRELAKKSPFYNKKIFQHE